VKKGSKSYAKVSGGFLRSSGRSSYLRDPQGKEKFQAAGGHGEKCPDTVGRAARMTVKMILEEGLV